MYSFYDMMEMGGTNNPGFQALPDFVQAKILSNMGYGGYYNPMMAAGGSTFSGNAFYQDGGQSANKTSQQSSSKDGSTTVSQVKGNTIVTTTKNPDGSITKKEELNPVYEYQKKLASKMYQTGGFIPEYDMSFPANYSVDMMEQGGIHLDPSKKGTFKAQATRMGMGVQEAASAILNAPEGKYSPAMRKKANFAKNFAKQAGGPVEGEVLDVSPEELDLLRQQGYQFEIM